jgi:hypothetical protein
MLGLENREISWRWGMFTCDLSVNKFCAVKISQGWFSRPGDVF